MSASRIRFATIGTWGHLSEVFSELSEMPEVELVAHARAMPDDDLPHLRRLAGTATVPWYEDYRKMLLEARPDVVAIGTRIDRVSSIAVDVANAGCHLICEKPMAIDHQSLAALFQACLTNRVQCISMLGNGRHPVMQAAVSVLQAGRAGDIVLVNARKSYRWGHRPEWFGDRKIYGGTICWIAVHALEMVHILSQQKFISVAAVQSNLTHPDRPDCEDNGIIMLRLSGGGSASISFDYLRPDAAATHGDDWVRVVGSKGIVEAGLDRRECKFVGINAPEQDIPLPEKGSYFATFVRSVSKEGNPSTEMRRAFMLNHVCLCARDAADQGVVIQIPPGPWDELS